LRPDGVLTFQVPPQPLQELEGNGTLFRQKTLHYSVQFVPNRDAEVPFLMWSQPGGMWLMARRVRASPRTAPAPPAPAQNPLQHTLFPPIEGAGPDAVDHAVAEVLRLQFLLNPQIRDPAEFGREFDGFNREIAQARQGFWSEYPSGPRRRETEARF